MKASFGIFLGSLLLLASLPSGAATVSVSPASQSVAAGSPFNVDLVVSGLVDGATPSLGTFDLVLNFDPALLSFNTASYGDATLGDQLDLAQLGSITTTTPGTGQVQLYELSLDTADDLNNLQADTFRLATLSFYGLAAGTSPLTITLNAAGDADGDALALTTQDGGVNVTAVPLPAAWVLLGSGLMMVGRFGRQSNCRLDS